MSKVKFISRVFNNGSLALLKTTDGIMLEYARQGYTLTLRQLYYQMVARDLFPDAWIDPQTGTKNNIKNYKRFGDLVNNGRLAGMLDWSMIEDRARETQFPSCWNDPGEIVRACAEQFRIDKWENQPVHIEVFVEKDAVSGILAPVCRKLQVRFTANRGYASSSLYYEVSQRLLSAHRNGKDIHILYLGDHDPSSMDMTRDLTDRMNLFTYDSFDITVARLALNMDQVRTWGPPENPAKETDSRFAAYRNEYGESSWELDAVEPRTLASLVRDYVIDLRDADAWVDAEKKEYEMRDRLQEMSDELGKES